MRPALTPPIEQSGQPGFLLLEALLGISLLALFLSAALVPLLSGQEQSLTGGDRQRANYINQSNIEGLRSLRNGSFALLTTGQHGIAVNANNQWTWSGASVLWPGDFRSRVTVTQLAGDWMQIKSDTSWQRGFARSGTQTLYTDIFDWRVSSPVGDWRSPSIEGQYTDPGSPMFNHVAITGDYAYVTSFRDDGGGKGLAIFDIADLTNPLRLNDSFDLGFAAYDAVIAGNVLYLTTGDCDAELKGYDISVPDLPQLIVADNINGCGRARPLAVWGDKLFVGAEYNAAAGESELYVFRIQQPSLETLSRLSDTDEADSVYDIALVGTGSTVTAYLASAGDTTELRVYQAVASGSLSVRGSYNLSDRTEDARSIAAAGTAALLGTERSTSTQELVLLDTVRQGAVPTGVTGPWYREGSGSLYDLAIDPTNCYVFMASQEDDEALQIANFRDKDLFPALYSYVSSTGKGRGIYYDMPRDRVYLLTDQSFIIFRPSAPPSDCP